MWFQCGENAVLVRGHQRPAGTGADLARHPIDQQSQSNGQAGEPATAPLLRVGDSCCDGCSGGGDDHRVMNNFRKRADSPCVVRAIDCLDAEGLRRTK